MPTALTLGRWRIDLYERALYLQRQPDPKCAECHGEGTVETPAEHALLPDAQVEPCACWDPFKNIRIPLGRRLVITERWPL
ncbi:hypothetical protein AVW11_03805 [Streptomyces amritsarensis]|uniref:Uncharacterized protein n=1 Tax=Streptomyces amritsarensis TaxID=681158 RepID=A0ABX3G8Q5_9ACTN|nr:hypothetical protein [Streptomyces amritsarensis]OLZ72527.1 hypothetical protein AVW11_03805 [Streptomyces amritsarensis]